MVKCLDSSTVEVMTYSRSIDENLLIYKILWFVSIGSHCSSDRTIGDWSSCLSGPLWFENSRVNQSKGPSLLVRQHLDSLTSARAFCIRNGWSNWQQVASRIENSLRTKWFAWTLRERQVHISLLLRSSESYWWWSITSFILSFTTIILFWLNTWQTRFDYLSHGSLTVDPDIAVQLCCLEIRRFFKDVSASTLEKRSNLEYLEKEFGLRSFLPECVIANVKSKNLKKMIQQQSKKCVALAESACMFKFLDLLRTVYRYDREKFQCDLGVNNGRVIYQFLQATHFFFSDGLVHSSWTHYRPRCWHLLHG